jgi:hypothetical protein
LRQKSHFASFRFNDRKLPKISRTAPFRRGAPADSPTTLLSPIFRQIASVGAFFFRKTQPASLLFEPNLRRFFSPPPIFAVFPSNFEKITKTPFFFLLFAF